MAQSGQDGPEVLRDGHTEMRFVLSNPNLEWAALSTLREAQASSLAVRSLMGNLQGQSCLSRKVLLCPFSEPSSTPGAQHRHFPGVIVVRGMPEAPM